MRILCIILGLAISTAAFAQTDDELLNAKSACITTLQSCNSPRAMKEEQCQTEKFRNCQAIDREWENRDFAKRRASDAAAIEKVMKQLQPK